MEYTQYHTLPNQIFFILADAFQHTDWDRRDAMADKMINLAKASWQIIYLTMDDQIRDMFQQKGQQAFGDQMVLHEL